MHAERTGCPRTVPAIQTQSVVMMVLLAGEHEPWTKAELEREIAGTRDDPVAVTDAIRELHGAGLVNITDQLVTPTRAAQKMNELTDGAI